MINETDFEIAEIPFFTDPSVKCVIDKIQGAENHRYSNVQRLLAVSNLDLSALEDGQLIIRNYRQITPEDLHQRNIFIGDCIECAMQQFNYCTEIAIENDKLQSCIFCTRIPSANHFMFGFANNDEGSNVLGIVFDNAQNNKVFPVYRDKQDQIDLGPYVATLKETISKPSIDWRFGRDDIYALNEGVDGWKLSETSYYSSMGRAWMYGLKGDSEQVLLDITNRVPYVDIVVGERSILEVSPESDLAKLLIKWRKINS